MSTQILTLTLVLLAVPLVLFLGVLSGRSLLLVPFLLVVAIYAWVWFWFRPGRFVVHQRVLEVVWPLRRREIPREDIASVRLIDGQEVRREIGWGMRVGAGGLWGGFGWLWMKHRGIVQMYISRTDRFIWIERTSTRPWLITPGDPEGFVHALTS